jgi:uncharacterized protein YpmB
MTNAATAEAYFILAMMILIMILSVSATYIFFRQYNREKNNKEKINEEARRQAAKESK